MITAKEIDILSKLDTGAVEFALRRNYPQDRLTSSKFVGITDDGQFAYRCKYREDGGVTGGSVCFSQQPW